MKQPEQELVFPKRGLHRHARDLADHVVGLPRCDDVAFRQFGQQPLLAALDEREGAVGVLQDNLRERRRIHGDVGRVDPGRHGCVQLPRRQFGGEVSLHLSINPEVCGGVARRAAQVDGGRRAVRHFHVNAAQVVVPRDL